MARKNQVIHINSNVIGKLPTGSTESVIDYGEIAVNYNETDPFLSILKNGKTGTSNTDFAKFSADDVLTATFDNRYASSSDITDLQGEIGNKAEKTHSHGTISLTGGASGSASFTNTGASISVTVDGTKHNHDGVYQPKGNYASASTITDIEGDIQDLQNDFNDLVGEIEQIELTTANALNQLNAAMDGKSDVGHTHEEYLQETDLTDIKGDIQNLENALGGKAASSHSHSASDITGSTKLSMNVIPTGTTNTSVAVGNHNHDTKYAPISDITSINSQIETINSNLNGKAPNSHASSNTDYGVGTTSNYGHVKINNGDVDTVASSDGVAAGMNHTHSTLATKSDVTTLQSKIEALGNVFKYCGVTTTPLTDGSTTNPVVINGSNHNAEQGCVVFYGKAEFFFNGTSWEQLGDSESNTYKVVQTAVSDPTASGSGTTFIASISQDANGVITATKKNVQFPTVATASTSAYGVTKLSSATNSTSTSLAATPSAVKSAYDLANGKWTKVDASTSAAGIVQLDNSLSTSTTKAITPNAVKNAIDEINTTIEDNEEVISGALNTLNEGLDGKADVDHTHDDYATAAFSTVSANGTSIAADSIGDTLTIATGDTFIKITGDATNDKITFGINTGTTSTTVARGDHSHSQYSVTGHTHSASDITGTTKLSMNVIPTGTTSSTVSRGDHTHSSYAASTHSHGSIWGQSLSGTAGVSGNMSSVGSITPSSNGTYDIGTTSTKFKNINLSNSANIGNSSIVYNATTGCLEIIA